MSGPSTGPGKTAPKLCDDFLNFDPFRSAPGRNLLADHSPPVGEGPLLSWSDGCKHEYFTKHVQSVLPPLDLRPDGTTQYKLAAVCKKCRLHAVIFMNFARATNPCPNADHPLHHFQRQPYEDDNNDSQIKYAWQCSASQCEAHLAVVYTIPRLSEQERILLTDTEQLKRRYEATVNQDHNRDGLRQATPMEALSRLRKYISDSLSPTHTKRAFPANNKRFMEAFGVRGEDCMELLTRLGFKYADAEWTLPNPPEIDDRSQADGGSQRELLEDVVCELTALMYKTAADTGSMNPAAAEGWPSSNRDLERTLAAQGYQRHSSLRRPNTANEELPYFASLGVLPDFSDSLIEFAFDRQLDCDPERQAYYYECLQIISESRHTEQLQTKVVLLQSEGLVSRRDLAAAYLSLGLQRPTGEQIVSEQHILSSFQARQANVSPATAAELRQALYKIGQHRDSKMLMNASQQTVETYEDAIAWLGNDVNEGTPDDIILVIAATKMDTPSDSETTKKAISIIARKRNSNSMNDWLLTGRSDGTSMSVDEALRHLGIEQSLDKVDKDMLQLQIASARDDKPGEQTEKAIKTIEQALGSSSGYTQTTTMQHHAPATWPVGLKSHGNTCYLNSLLQYYFCIKPFRKIILDYGKYKLDLKEIHEKRHRVGGRMISAQEIKAGQRFAKDLQSLFQRMIAEPSMEVKPEKDMVSRAFLEAEQYDQLPSSAMDEEIVWEKPSSTKGAEGTLSQSQNQPPTNGDDGTNKMRKESDASSITLQASANGDDDAPMSNSGAAPPTPPLSPVDKAADEIELVAGKPPLPPRRRFTNAQLEKASDTALSKAEAKAAMQQDVSEVHDNATQRLRAGLRVDGADANDEQQDVLRALYTIAINNTTFNRDGTSDKPMLRPEPDLALNVPLADTDIYSALDEILDPQPSNTKPGASVYSSLMQPLPQILQIKSPRINWDAKTQAAKKYDATMRLVDELYLDRYCDDSDPNILATRKKCWGWRKQLRALEKEKKELTSASPALDLNSVSAMAEASRFLESIEDIDKDLADIDAAPLDIATNLAVHLSTAAAEQATRLKKIDAEIDDLKGLLAPQFEDAKKIKYRLAVVFFHRGNTSGGHYWVCIHDFTNDIWRTYNDETVSEVPKSDLKQIFEAQGFTQGTPTYMVYVRDDEKEQLVQPLCREPGEVVPGQAWAAEEIKVDAMETSDPKAWNPKAAEAPADGTVNMAMVQEGGEKSWDNSRQVADADW
ncbi:ubiquitin-specific protease ubp2 [Recurvomyces mirabilis]|uniref:ubiquitinyl hydrolase 1 n=1 Tax=Recurvomyces mirabilis TaxID=574656 RepID=A0AAE0WST6_9PEZI|nr:ubiquitin-specific protease ubp2 [Recurvomyces mirabilis]KAK5159375.1 ubiquitin-specific protease ubp2 [Recurvomyces mirabilis]